MGRFLLLGVALVAACGFPHPSDAYTCKDDGDCDGGRTCSDQGFCVFDDVATDAAVDAAPDAPTIDADPFAATRAQCLAAGYVMEATTGGLYRSVNGNLSWSNAEADCANDVTGATHLIVPAGPAEVAYMKTQLGWVGYNDRAAEDMWRDVLGNALVKNTLPWASGRPDNGGGGSDEDCVEMKTGGLDDDQCGNNNRYVCECDGIMPMP